MTLTGKLQHLDEKMVNTMAIPYPDTAELQNLRAEVTTPEQFEAMGNEQALAHMNAQQHVLAANGVDASVNLNIDVNALIEAIGNAINSNHQREAFVKTALETVTSQIRGSHNIMVFNMQQGFEFDPDWNWTWFTSRSFQKILYGIWVFRGPVRFVNKGDGGWINWGFYGAFQRNRGTLDFQQF